MKVTIVIFIIIIIIIIIINGFTTFCLALAAFSVSQSFIQSLGPVGLWISPSQ
jgi:hypothetical protein